MSDPQATARPCPYCRQAVVGPHEGCAGLFKDIMSAPAESIDDLPPEARPYDADESRQLDDYLLINQIGKGGMGTVWRAWDRKLTRWVAVKFLNGQDQDDFARFSREAKLAARLRHPNIAAVFDTGEAPSRQAGQDAVRYLAMEYIEGQSVSTAELPLAKWLEIFARVARAVDHAHRSGVVHRDLKPSNLILTKEDWPYVMDFGLAKSLKAGSSVSLSGVILGTPAFMPPEQAAGKIRETDERSDVYSLGATLYFVLTRSEPYKGEDSVDILLQVLQKEPKRPRELRPDLPEAVEAVILKAMARDKNQRYLSAGEMADDLDRLLAPGAAAPQPPRSKAPLLFLGALAAAAVIALIVVAGQKPPPPPLLKPTVIVGPAAPSPLPAYFEGLQERRSGRRWKDAVAWIEKEGSVRKTEDRANDLQEVEDGCRRFLLEASGEFCSLVLMEKLRNPPPGFLFASLEGALPAPEQLLLPHVAYDWTRSLLPLLDAARAPELCAAAEAAALFEDAGENPWFKAAELAAFNAVLRDMTAQSARAAGAPLAEIAVCRRAAQESAARWIALLGKLSAPFRRRIQSTLDPHQERIARASAAFPEEPPFLRTLDLARIVGSADAELRLEEVEQALAKLRLDGSLPRESQQTLLVALVSASALRRFYQGGTAEQVAAALTAEFRKPLQDLKVPETDRTKFGPKLASVFERLLR